MNDKNKKIKVLKVILTFTECPDFRCPKSFSSLVEADMFIYHFHRKAIEEKNKGKLLGYYKTDFTIIFEDGDDYKGRFDIGSDRDNISEHVKAFCLVYGGVKKPSHMTDENWEDFKQQIRPEVQEWYKQILEKYDI